MYVDVHRQQKLSQLHKAVDGEGLCVTDSMGLGITILSPFQKLSAH